MRGELLEVADDDNEVIPLPFIEQQLATVALVKGMCETYNFCFDVQGQQISLQRSVCLERAKNGSQTDMTNSFSI